MVWPHEAFNSVQGRRTFAFNDMPFPALIGGAIASLFNTPDFEACPDGIRTYLRHLSLLAHAQTRSGDTAAVREFHRAVLVQVEAGHLRWTAEHADLFEELKINFLAGLRTDPARGDFDKDKKQDSSRSKDKQHPKRKAEADEKFCSAFNKGKCVKTESDCSRQHYCYHCYVERKRKESHPSDECMAGPPGTGGRRK